MTKNDLKYAIKEIVYEMLDENTCVNCGSLVDENLRKWFKDKWVNIGKKIKMVHIHLVVQVVKKEHMQNVFLQVRLVV